MKKNSLYRVTRDSNFTYWAAGENDFSTLIFQKEGALVQTTEICKLIDISLEDGSSLAAYRFYLVDRDITISITHSIKYFESIPINHNKIWNNLNV